MHKLINRPGSSSMGPWVVFFLMLSAGQVRADEEALSAKELLVNCEENTAPGRPSQYCMRYVFGLVQTIDMLQQAGSGQKLFCIDPNVIGLEEVTIKVTVWLKARQDRLDEDAYVLVSEALNAEYPCKLQDI